MQKCYARVPGVLFYKLLQAAALVTKKEKKKSSQIVALTEPQSPCRQCLPCSSLLLKPGRRGDGGGHRQRGQEAASCAGIVQKLLRYYRLWYRI